MNSIIQKHKECYVCMVTQGLECHHVFNKADRDKSEQYGLTVWLCHRHHNEPPYGVHHNVLFDKSLKALAQRCFMVEYPHLDFMQIFGRNYIDENEIKEKQKEWTKTHRKKRMKSRYPSKTTRN